MTRLHPIYTEKTECQDCYKCLRNCPVKAIQIKDGSAAIIPELCIACGNCVSVCPVHAKRIRHDLDKAKDLIKQKSKVLVSLAPSFVGEYSNIVPGKLIAAFKKIGIHAVSETALGAQMVSRSVANYIKQSEKNIHISTACPSVVELIQKYYPEFSDKLTPFYSPLLSHCHMLRNEYPGEDIGLIFVGPCIAKKTEADRFSSLLDLSLTFKDLNQWFESEGVNVEEMTFDEKDSFVPFSSHDGALYPMDGGMIASIKVQKDLKDVTFMSFSGVDNIKSILEGLKCKSENSKVFLELLACEGGCINGPCSNDRNSTVKKRLDVDQYFQKTAVNKVEFNPELISHKHDEHPVEEKHFSVSQIRSALKMIGKQSEKDELNCGGCGYNSCKNFAMALLQERAEPSMCVSYMRDLALNKMNALIHAMPAGVVIIDDNLKIVDCNRKFAEIIGDDLLMMYDNVGNLNSVDIERAVPFHKLYSIVLGSHLERIEKQIRHKKSILHVSIFIIGSHRMVGSIIQDVTRPSMHREQIIKNAQEVVKKNLKTVQQIAYLLGENAAESEVMLNSIVESFSLGEAEYEDDSND